MKFKHQAKALKEIRTEMGLTQRELGKILGVQFQAVCNAENGIRGIPYKRLSKLQYVDRNTMFSAIAFDFERALEKVLKL